MSRKCLIYLIAFVPLFVARPAQGAPPDAKELESLWKDLADEDAAKAYRAIWKFVASEQSVTFLRKHLEPARGPDPQRLTRLLADLDSKKYPVREKALEELAKLGELAEPGLKRVLEGKPTLEVRQRVERLLEQLEGPIISPDRLRELRAIEALERIGSPEARRLLQDLAKGAPEARLTQEAKAADKRLSSRTSAPR